MAYQKTNWIDNETPIDANNLNKMEQGIEDAAKTGGILAGTVVGWNGEGIPEGYEEVEKGYSITEKLTGETWIDGKPLYRKVIKGIIPTKGTFLSIDLNYDTLAFERLSFVSSAGYTVTNGYYDNVSQFSYVIGVNAIYFSTVDTDFEGREFTLIAEYTKTTD